MRLYPLLLNFVEFSYRIDFPTSKFVGITNYKYDIENGGYDNLINHQHKWRIK